MHPMAKGAQKSPVRAFSLALIAAMFALSSLAGCDDDPVYPYPFDVQLAGDSDTANDTAVDTNVDDVQSGEDATDTLDEDTVVPDTGSPDTDLPDTGSPDTESPDSGAADTELPDTGDRDTSPDAGPEVETQCDDDRDNDGDGQFDCADSDCADAVECIVCDEGVVRGGECVAAFDPDAVGAFDGTLSYIVSFEIPPNDTEAACCFDVTGDGEPDNGFAAYLGAIAAGGVTLDFNADVSQAIRDGDIAAVLEWGKGEDGDGFWLYDATNDLDDSGAPDQTWEARSSGDGVFRVREASLDAYGALVQFNSASDGGSWFDAGLSEFPLLGTSVIPIGFAGDVAAWTVRGARLRGPYFSDASGRASGVVALDSGEGAQVYGLWELGGYIDVDQLGAQLETTMRSCTCAGFDTSRPIVAYGDDGDAYEFECVQAPVAGCTSSHGICENVSTICGFLPSLAAILPMDIDSNGNGVPDAMSFGARIEAVGATFDACVVDDGCPPSD